MKASEIDSLDFAKGNGLLPAVIQHARSGVVLMVGYVNREALHETIRRGRVVFYSRTKQRLWEKGETSEHFLNVKEIRADCDRDALLITAIPEGPVCHLGSITCFGEVTATIGGDFAFLPALEEIIEQRIRGESKGSYTTRLYAQGAKRIAQKLGEEGLELALAGASEADDRVIAESADLLFHLLVLLRSRGLSLSQVLKELEDRHHQRTGRCQ